MDPLDHRQHGDGVVTIPLRPEDRDGSPAALAALREIAGRLELERLKLFRLRLATLIRDVSPVVIDLADLFGIGVDEIAAGFRPRPKWSPMLHGSAGRRADPHRNVHDGKHLGADAPVRLTGRDQRVGGELTCAFSLLAGRIEAMAVLGDVSVQTCGDRVGMLLPRKPDDAVPAVGTSADLYHSTELLLGRGYAVETIDDRFASGLALITMRTGMTGHVLHFVDVGEDGEEAA